MSLNADTPRLEALDKLGHGIDLTSAVPFNIKSVSRWIKDRSIVQVDNDTKTHTITIGNVDYVVPHIVSVTVDGEATQSYNFFSSGTEVLHELAGISNHLAIRAPTSSYPVDKSFPDDFQFAFWQHGASNYTAYLREYNDFIDQKDLASVVRALPTPFTDDPTTLAAYKTFFATFGSHVITSVTFGASCSMAAWASNKYPEVRENWSKDVTTFLRGLNHNGEYDASVILEPQYRIFETICQASLMVVGGDPELAKLLQEGFHDMDIFKQWSQTTHYNPALTSIASTEIWSLFRDSDDTVLNDAADNLQKAFEAIDSRSRDRTVTTLVILESLSDVAQLSLLSPGAVIGVGGPLPAFDPTTLDSVGLSSTKVRMGTDNSGQLARIIVFYIVNDGSPIDIAISGGNGIANARINGSRYSNEELRVKRFYQVSVSSD